MTVHNQMEKQNGPTTLSWRGQEQCLHMQWSTGFSGEEKKSSLKQGLWHNPCLKVRCPNEQVVFQKLHLKTTRGKWRLTGAYPWTCFFIFFLTTGSNWLIICYYAHPQWPVPTAGGEVCILGGSGPTPNLANKGDCRGFAVPSAIYWAQIVSGHGCQAWTHYEWGAVVLSPNRMGLVSTSLWSEEV